MTVGTGSKSPKGLFIHTHKFPHIYTHTHTYNRSATTSDKRAGVIVKGLKEEEVEGPAQALDSLSTYHTHHLSRTHTYTHTHTHQVLDDKRAGVIVKGLKEEEVEGPAQALELIAMGEDWRHTGATELNAESSRCVCGCLWVCMSVFPSVYHFPLPEWPPCIPSTSYPILT